MVAIQGFHGPRQLSPCNISICIGLVCGIQLQCIGRNRAGALMWYWWQWYWRHILVITYFTILMYCLNWLGMTESDLCLFQDYSQPSLQNDHNLPIQEPSCLHLSCDIVFQLLNAGQIVQSILTIMVNIFSLALGKPGQNLGQHNVVDIIPCSF